MRRSAPAKLHFITKAYTKLRSFVSLNNAMAAPVFSPRGPLPELRTRAPVKVMGTGAVRYARGREIAALLLWVGALFLAFGLASYEVDPKVATDGLGAGPNWMGSAGASAARLLVSAIGVIAWFVPVELALLGIPYIRSRKSEVTPLRLGGGLLIAVLASALVQVGWPRTVAFGQAPAAGLVGELFGELLRSLFSTAGSFLIGVALLGLILIGRATFSFIALMNWAWVVVRVLWKHASTLAQKLTTAWRAARDEERQLQAHAPGAHAPHITLPSDGDAVIVTRAVTEDALLACDVPPALFEGAPDFTPAPAKSRKGAPVDWRTVDAPTDVSGAPVGMLPTPLSGQALIETPVSNSATEPVPAAQAPEALAAEAPAQPKVAKKKESGPVVPTIVDTSSALKKETGGRKKERAQGAGFQLPSLDFLTPSKHEPHLSIDRDILLKNSELLIKTLADYGVSGKVEEILPGPTVTTYEVSPAAGTKVSKVASLADDLALALARKVRIVAPIPGKNRIGFELPNERRSPVSLRDLVEDERFRTLDVPLPVVMGRDIVGNPVYADLASMPHVIVAGATGAGKSVGLNVMLTSLLYRRSPEDLRMLMIDPKVVELAPFDRIPHMLLPVVTDMKQASNALKWAVDEMERRYQLFADAGTKNITTYNQWVIRVGKGEAKNPLPRTVQTKDHNGFIDEIATSDPTEGTQALPEKMPFIVIVVDEFADLMMQQGKEVEVAVARLAQKARAAGMHVILATQRPSVDVITGMIKANFPTRIAFRVAQKVDSRTILDEQGAEHLLGRGDMLIRLNGTNETRRVQCPWVSEEEVQAVTDHLRLQGEPVYDESILKPRDEDGNAEADEEESQDAMYDDAVRIVADTRRCSTSWLQRKLGLGYNRAARIVEMMEKRGLVGSANGSKDREVLISSL
jgi:DNA segregation ATPase FtsK/SpoIIIE, S-DNA-T family